MQLMPDVQFTCNNVRLGPTGIKQIKFTSLKKTLPV